MSDPLLAFGWTDRVAALWATVDIPSALPGRVIRVDRGSCIVATANGTVRADPFGLLSRRHGLDVVPAAGDWVALLDGEPSMAIVAVLERWSAITRLDPDPNDVRDQVLASNVDVVAAVEPFDRPLSDNRLERFVAVAWDSGATPAVLLTKADACDDPSRVAAAVEAIAPGVDVIVTSAHSGVGVDAVRALVPPGRTLVLLGQSGVGKSTLVNALLDHDVQRTGEVRERDHRGRHTTTTRDLIPLPGGGVLVDTPGIRSLGLWGGDDGIDAVFPEIDELAAGCRFRDCRHEGEPDCAVAAAVQAGGLDARRLGAYHKLRHELEAVERRLDVRARRAEARRWGRMYQEVKKLKPNRRT